jgi:hypothetical protein
VTWNPEGSAPAPPSTLDRRNRLIGVGGGVAAACAVLAAVGGLMALISDLKQHVITGVSVSDGFGLVSPAMLVVGAATLGAAFLGPADRRRPRLARAALTLAFSFLAVCVAASILGGIFAAHHVLGSLTGATIASAVAAVIVAVAFLTTASAFGARVSGTDRGNRLGHAAVVFAAAMAASITSNVLALVADSKLHADATLTTVAWLDVVGVLIEFGVGIVLASAFYASAAAQRARTADWQQRRDRLLAVAAAALVVSLLIYGVGTVIEATQVAAAAPGLAKAARWVAAISNVTIVAGFAFLTAGLSASGWRRS